MSHLGSSTNCYSEWPLGRHPMMNSRFEGLLAALLSGFMLLPSVGACAQDAGAYITLAATRSVGNDEFTSSVLKDLTLGQSGIQVVIKSFGDPTELLKSILAGSVDLGVIDLDTLVQLEPQLGVAAVLTPFQFRSNDELSDVLNSWFGDAILADIGRTGLVPISLSNRGLTKIVSERDTNSYTFFKGSHVATTSHSSSSALKALGAEVYVRKTGEPPSAALAEHKADALETSNWGVVQGFKARTLVSGFRPIIYAAVANSQFWENLTEVRRKALAGATTRAAKRADLVVRLDDDAARKKFEGEIRFVSFNDEELASLGKTSARATANSSNPEILWSFQLLDSAKAAAAAQKKNNK
jgi:TRAP-type C4-dicarboxylate transport system substrate-binding protein